MSYIVPKKLPKHCNKCPFGMCCYSSPFGTIDISRIDGKENRVGTYGYTCNLEFDENGRYTKVLRAEIGKDIIKPKWCRLKKYEEEEPICLDVEELKKNIRFVIKK